MAALPAIHRSLVFAALLSLTDPLLIVNGPTGLQPLAVLDIRPASHSRIFSGPEYSPAGNLLMCCCTDPGISSQLQQLSMNTFLVMALLLLLLLAAVLLPAVAVCPAVSCISHL